MQNIVITFSPKLLYIIFLNENCNYFKSEFTTQMWTNTPPPMSSSKMWALTPGALGFPSGLAEGQKVPAACRTLEPEYHTPSHELVFSQALLLCPPRLRSHPCPPLVPFLPLTTRPPVSPPKPRTLPSTARALPPPCPHGVSAERLPGSAELRPHSRDPHKPGPTPPPRPAHLSSPAFPLQSSPSPWPCSSDLTETNSAALPGDRSRERGA